MARNATSWRLERAHERLRSGQNARLRAGIQMARPWSLRAGTPDNSHRTPTAPHNSRCAPTSAGDSLRCERQPAQPDPRRGEDRVADGGGEADDRGLARARGREVLAVQDDDLDLGDIGEARDAVLREPRGENAPVFEAHGLKERTADRLHDGALDLVAETGRVDDGAAVEGRDDAADVYAARLGVDLHVGARRQVAALVRGAGDAEAALLCRVLLAPVELLGRRLQDGLEPRVGEVREAEGKRVERESMRDLVHVGLSREVVCGGGKAAVGALPERRGDGMELDLLVRHGVGRADGGGAGVVVMELPRRERAVAARAAFDVEDARGPEVGPRKLLLARPRDLDGLAGCLREASSLDGGVARVLAAVARAGVGHDDADLISRNVERVGQLVAHCERALRAGPDGEPIAGPLGDRRARLEGHVGDVLDGVRLLELDVGGRHCLVDRAGGAARPTLAALFYGVLPQEREQSLV